MNNKVIKRRTKVHEHTIRAADGGLVKLRLTRKLAMSAFCTECLGFDDNPQSCTAPLCPLYPFRAKTLRTKKGNVKEGDE